MGFSIQAIFSGPVYRGYIYIIIQTFFTSSVGIVLLLFLVSDRQKILERLTSSRCSQKQMPLRDTRIKSLSVLLVTLNNKRNSGTQSFSSCV